MSEKRDKRDKTYSSGFIVLEGKERRRVFAQSCSTQLVDLPDNDEDEILEDEEVPLYSTDDTISAGCFFMVEDLNRIPERWRSKKNLILQGPLGTGKTWLPWIAVTGLDEIQEPLERSPDRSR